MKKQCLSLAALAITLTAAAQNGDYPIKPVPFTQVQVTDAFWMPRLQTNARVTIPYIFAQCRKYGRIDNFLRAAGKLPADTLTAFTFDDTDVYKAIEGASYSLQTKPDARLSRYLDTIIAIIGSAQEPDGYLYTFRTMKPKKPHPWMGAARWVNEEDLSHELYNAGHLYESAVAHYLATGKKNLLNIALKNADLLVKTFGPGKEEKFPGHQIVEIGLVKLYRVTGNKQYLDLAKYFLDLRGKPGHKNQAYSQSQVPVVDQHTAVGHAVRATYMYTGMADVAALTGDREYLAAIDDIWNDVVDKKIYITGGIGATNNGEAFGAAWDLPNMSAYAETCASIANVYWNSRMFLLHGDAKYIDVLERILYNGLLSGVSLSGDRFFYPNPLASIGQHQRSAWFDCACCISNMTRFLPSMPGYVYAQNKNDLYINLFLGSKATIKLPAATVALEQKTNYPWNGDDIITVNPNRVADFTLKVRIPGWAQGAPIPGALYTTMGKFAGTTTMEVNGQPFAYAVENGYAVISRNWKPGDKVTVHFPMDILKLAAADSVKADQKRFALQRGPLVYCLEGPDNRDSAVMNIVVDKATPVREQFQPALLNGVMTLQMKGSATRRQLNSDELIRTEQAVTAIPYYAWANRGPSEMEVWIPSEASAARPKPAPSIASRSKVSGSVSSQRMLRALNDQYEPQDSKDNAAPYLHWWPKKNTTEWVQYDFDRPQEVSFSSVYWFDDGPWGGCRVPASWTLLYKKGDEWVPVENASGFGTAKDKYNEVQFDPVVTTALRLEVKLPADNASGIHEWIVR